MYALNCHESYVFKNLCNVLVRFSFVFSSKRAIPRQNRLDRSQDKEESVPLIHSHYKHYCGERPDWRRNNIMTDDVIALSMPNALFLASNILNYKIALLVRIRKLPK